MSIKKSASNVVEKILTYEEQQAKVFSLICILSISGSTYLYFLNGSLRHEDATITVRSKSFLPSWFTYFQINEVRSSLGTLSGKSSVYCSDASIARHLTARNWNVKKATKMLKETLKWRSEYKPEEIRWVWYHLFYLSVFS